MSYPRVCEICVSYLACPVYPRMRYYVSKMRIYPFLFCDRNAHVYVYTIRVTLIRILCKTARLRCRVHPDCEYSKRPE